MLLLLISLYYWLGQQYDKNGNRVNWWNESSIVAFKNRTQCFVDQYNQYEQQGVKVCTSLSVSDVYTHYTHVAIIRSMVNSHLVKILLIMEASTLHTLPTNRTEESRTCILNCHKINYSSFHLDK